MNEFSKLFALELLTTVRLNWEPWSPPYYDTFCKTAMSESLKASR